jgi:hypothetical protein
MEPPPEPAVVADVFPPGAREFNWARRAFICRSSRASKCLSAAVERCKTAMDAGGPAAGVDTPVPRGGWVCVAGVVCIAQAVVRPNATAAAGAVRIVVIHRDRRLVRSVITPTTSARPVVVAAGWTGCRSCRLRLVGVARLRRGCPGRLAGMGGRGGGGSRRRHDVCRRRSARRLASDSHLGPGSDYRVA